MKKDQILLKVFKSRKSHLHYYLMILIVILLNIFIYLNSKNLDYRIVLASLIFITIIFWFIEVDIVRNWWAITDTFLIESKSILNKNVREIEFNSIADIDLDQPLLKRILGYGTVNIRKYLNEKSIIIEDIDSPEKFINLLQEAIQKRKQKK
jgi:uncharacterized membrane protein YdbT with pleckstrin-like domain